MGCDYYIYVYLEIQHKHGISYYPFPIIRGYYPDLDCGFADSDDESVDKYYNLPEYNKLYDDMIKMAMTPRNPVIIYTNGKFVSQKFEIKYSRCIQNKLDKIYENEWSPFEDTGVAFNNISEIICVTRKEIRQERGGDGPSFYRLEDNDSISIPDKDYYYTITVEKHNNVLNAMKVKFTDDQIWGEEQNHTAIFSSVMWEENDRWIYHVNSDGCASILQYDDDGFIEKYCVKMVDKLDKIQN